MRPSFTILGHTVVFISLAALSFSSQANEVTAERVINAMEKVFGVHAGERRNHIKGTCAEGEFIGNPEVQRYSRSALFSGESIPVVARFSLAGGNPALSDTAKNPRGMALEFRLPSGALQHMTMLNTPMFGVATPKGFLDDIESKIPDPVTGKPSPEKIQQFKKEHPESQAQAHYLATHNPPVSWGSSAYFGIHAFLFKDAKETITPVRWQFVPEQGEVLLSDEAVSQLPANFLEQRLFDDLAKSPLRWEMRVTLGSAEDPANDPTKTWPAERETIKAGTLILHSAMAQKDRQCEAINFDPMVMADGIEPSDDPVLRFRSLAYALSFARRLSEKIQNHP